MAINPHRRTEIEQLLALRRTQGLTFKAISERSGIPVGTLSYWSNRPRRKAKPQPDPEPTAFVELVSRPPVSPDASMRVKHPSGLIIELTGEAMMIAIERLLPKDGSRGC